MTHAVYALVLAAGRGVRFSSGGNKVFAELRGQSILRRSVQAFAAHPEIDGIVVVAGSDEIERCREELAGVDKLLGIVAGGTTRQASVCAGLFVLGTDGIVLVHDAARPLVNQDIISRCINSARVHGSGVAALPLADTLKSANFAGSVTGTVPRDGLWTVQTPQAFTLETLIQAHIQARDDGFIGTDDASLVERLGEAPVVLVEGAPENFKITRRQDLDLATAVIRGRDALAEETMRIGFGYDIHRLAAGRPLFLGGVEINDPMGRGLDGHSDADVLLHAVCDAILGAAGLPDIGVLFPNTDPAYKGISSIKLLDEVIRRIGAVGLAVSNLDITVIAEAPKIGLYVPAMRECIAGAVHVDGSRIGIKATTNEGLGAIGRGDGIAAHAVVCLRRVI